MGAHGAMQLALTHPGVFGAVGAHSLVLRRFGSAPAYFGDQVEYARRDPMTIVPKALDVVRGLKMWIDIGSADTWTPMARQFNAELGSLNVRHEWHEWPGDHSGSYWSAHLTDYLRFYDNALAESLN